MWLYRMYYWSKRLLNSNRHSSIARHTHTFINHQPIRIICVMAWFNILLNYTNRLQLAFIYGPQKFANLKFSIWLYRNRKIKFSNISAMLLRCKYKSKLKANRHMKHWRSFADTYGIWHISTNLKMSKSPFAFPTSQRSKRRDRWRRNCWEILRWMFLVFFHILSFFSISFWPSSLFGQFRLSHIRWVRVYVGCRWVVTVYTLYTRMKPQTFYFWMLNWPKKSSYLFSCEEGTKRGKRTPNV